MVGDSISPSEVEAFRRETPGCNRVIHFNNAGAALMPEPVLARVIGHLTLEAEIGGYEAFYHEEEKIEQFYELSAALLNCSPDEIAFIENATRAWDMAFYSIPLRAGDRILTSVAEYASNYIAYLQVARRSGIIVEVVPNDEFEQIDVAALESMIDERVRLISITHVPTNGGLVNPAEKVGAVARRYGVTFLLDACQSVGQLVIDVEKIQCDILSATGRKYLRGPRGTGLLYVRKEIQAGVEPIFLDVHAADWISDNTFKIREDARKFENWEQNFAGKLGLSQAIEYSLRIGLNRIEARVKLLADSLRGGIASIKGATLSDAGYQKCGIVSFFLEKHNADEVVSLLREQNISVSSSTVFGTRLDMERRSLPSLIRASVHYYNSELEVYRLLEAIERIVKSATSSSSSSSS